MAFVVAIDPGLTGALAFFRPSDPDHVATYDMPSIGSEVNVAEVSMLMQQWRPAIAFIERVGPMPRDGVRQAWRFSAAYTTVRVTATLLGIRTVLVTPGEWKKAMKVKGGKDGKEQCRALAIRLFPTCAHAFARKKDAGRAEAALLAYYSANLTPDEEHRIWIAN